MNFRRFRTGSLRHYYPSYAVPCERSGCRNGAQRKCLVSGMRFCIPHAIWHKRESEHPVRPLEEGKR